MKTIFSRSEERGAWSEIRFKLLLLLALLNVQYAMFNELQAQEAFYIYRNDGNFDGFFFDEVQSMSVSKFDLDSIEHDDYVVQDIVLADTTYRIPLAAIDSVGFQQPEIRFNERFHNLDELGILPEYIEYNGTADDVTTVYLHLPEHLKWWKMDIKKGDAIASITKPHYGAVGFSGKLTEVYEYYDLEPDGSKKIRLKFVPLDSYGDVFDQFITTERIYTDPQGNVSRRIAGCYPDGTPRRGPRKAYEDDFEKHLFDLQTTIARSWEPTDGVNIDLGADVAMKVGLRVTYNCSWRRIFVKFELPADFDITPTLTVKASKSFEAEVDGIPKFLKALKFPVQLPIFQTLPLPTVVVRGGGELAAKVSFPKVGFGISQNIVFDSNSVFPAQYYMTSHERGEEADEDAIDTGSAELTLSGFLQMAMKFSANIETCDWFSELLYCRLGIDFYVGPKVEGQVKLASFSAYKDNPNSLYMMFYTSGLTFTGLSCDLEAKATHEFLFKDREEHQFLTANKSFFQMQTFMIPQAINTTYNIEPGYPKGRITANMTSKNRSLLPTFIGVRGEGIEPKYATLPHTFTNDSLTSEIQFDLPPGRYKLRPCFKTLGIEYDISSFAHENYGYEGKVITDVDLLPTSLESLNGYFNVPVHRTTHTVKTHNNETTSDTTEESDDKFSFGGNSSFMLQNTEFTKSGDKYILTGSKTEDGTEFQLQLTIKMVDGLAYIVDGSLSYTYEYESGYQNDYSDWVQGKYADIHYTQKGVTTEQWNYSFSGKSVGCGWWSDGRCQFENDITLENVTLNRSSVYTRTNRWEYTAKDDGSTWADTDTTVTTTTDVMLNEGTSRVQFALYPFTPVE
jgi:hypothetical protein